MSFRFVITADPDVHAIGADLIRYARTEKEIAKCVAAIAAKVTEGGIMVYELKELHKMVEKPKFAKYSLNANGEILPL